MPRPPSQPSGHRDAARTIGRTSNLERRFNALRFIPVVFNGLGAELVEGVAGDCPIHFDGIIRRWRLLAIEAGDIQVDVWKTDYASFPPTVTDSITGSDVPTLGGTDHNESTSLDGWTTQVFAGDTLRFHIDSVSGITQATLTLAIAA